jgi:hypothetical protein
MSQSMSRFSVLLYVRVAMSQSMFRFSVLLYVRRYTYGRLISYKIGYLIGIHPLSLLGSDL